MTKGFKLTLATDESNKKVHAEMSLYGVISEFFGEINPQSVVDALSTLEADVLTLLINSVGGDPFGGFAIKNRIDKLVSEGRIGEVHTVAEGMVASAATIPYLAGETRTVLNGSQIMIHEARGFPEVASTADEFRQFAERLEATNVQATEFYTERLNHTQSEVAAMMKKTTWFQPGEAIAAGFATHNSDSLAVAACVDVEFMINRMHFENIPEDLLLESKEPEIDPREEQYRALVFDTAY